MTLMSDHAGNDLIGYDLTPDNDPRFRVEVRDDEPYADIEFTEPLQFHRELMDRERSRFGNGVTWSDIADANGWLTAESAARAVAELKRLLEERTKMSIDIERADHLEGDEEPTLGVSIRTEYQLGETVDQWFGRAGWPIIAEIINVTDPGTFNCPYWFTKLQYPNA